MSLWRSSGSARVDGWNHGRVSRGKSQLPLLPKPLARGGHCHSFGSRTNSHSVWLRTEARLFRCAHHCVHIIVTMIATPSITNGNSQQRSRGGGTGSREAVAISRSLLNRFVGEQVETIVRLKTAQLVFRKKKMRKSKQNIFIVSYPSTYSTGHGLSSIYAWDDSTRSRVWERSRHSKCRYNNSIVLIMFSVVLETPGVSMRSSHKKDGWMGFCVKSRLEHALAEKSEKVKKRTDRYGLIRLTGPHLWINLPESYASLVVTHYISCWGNAHGSLFNPIVCMHVFRRCDYMLYF